MVIGIVNNHGLARAKCTVPILFFHKKGQSLTVLLFSCSLNNDLVEYSMRCILVRLVEFHELQYISQLLILAFCY